MARAKNSTRGVMKATLTRLRFNLEEIPMRVGPQTHLPGRAIWLRATPRKRLVSAPPRFIRSNRVRAPCSLKNRAAPSFLAFQVPACCYCIAHGSGSIAAVALATPIQHWMTKRPGACFPFSVLSCFFSEKRSLASGALFASSGVLLVSSPILSSSCVGLVASSCVSNGVASTGGSAGLASAQLLILFQEEVGLGRRSVPALALNFFASSW